MLRLPIAPQGDTANIFIKFPLRLPINTTMGKPCTFTITALRTAVKNSRSIRQVLQTLNLSSQGGNYQTVYRLARKHNISLSALKGQGWSRGVLKPLRRPINDYLTNEFPIKSHALKLRLLREGIFTHQCSICYNTKWLDNPIPLELDHINGHNDDNTLTNLRLVCPNCHAQTPTYRGKNIGK